MPPPHSSSISTVRLPPSQPRGRERKRPGRGLDGAGLMGTQPIKKLLMSFTGAAGAQPEGLLGPEHHPGTHGRESRRARCPGAWVEGQSGGGAHMHQPPCKEETWKDGEGPWGEAKQGRIRERQRRPLSSTPRLVQPTQGPRQAEHLQVTVPQKPALGPRQEASTAHGEAGVI